MGLRLAAHIGDHDSERMRVYVRGVKDKKVYISQLSAIIGACIPFSLFSRAAGWMKNGMV